MTEEQIAAVKAILEWSTAPQSTLEYASMMVIESEKSLSRQTERGWTTPCSDELSALGMLILKLQDAFKNENPIQ